MAALWKRSHSTQRNSAVSSGYAVDAYHVPPGENNLEIAPAGSVFNGMSVNVAPSGGTILLYFQISPGNNQEILTCTAARDYRIPFYCPYPLYISTPGQGEDVTVFISPYPKGDTIA